MKARNILLDMDGVVCNFVGSCVKLFGKDEDEVRRRWEPMQFDIEFAMGITKEELWGGIDGAGEEYWSEMMEAPWARRLYSFCTNAAPTFFLTSPSHDPRSLSGKLKWMKRFTGDDEFRNYLVGPQKFLCAAPGNVLVDDADKNVQAFVEAGGMAITMPSVWNCMYQYDGDPCDYVISQLEMMLKA